MPVKLTEREAKSNIESRRNTKVQLWANYLFLVAVLVAYFAARKGTLAWDTFAASVVVVAGSSIMYIQFKVYPADEKLNALLE